MVENWWNKQIKKAIYSEFPLFSSIFNQFKAQEHPQRMQVTSRKQIAQDHSNKKSDKQWIIIQSINSSRTHIPFYIKSNIIWWKIYRDCISTKQQPKNRLIQRLKQQKTTNPKQHLHSSQVSASVPQPFLQNTLPAKIQSKKQKQQKKSVKISPKSQQ